MPTVQIEVRKNQNESPTMLIRRFSKRVQGANIVRGAKARRYFQRPKSETAKRKSALAKNEKRAQYARAYKLGEISNGFRKKTRA